MLIQVHNKRVNELSLFELKQYELCTFYSNHCDHINFHIKNYTYAMCIAHTTTAWETVSEYHFIAINFIKQSYRTDAKQNLIIVDGECSLCIYILWG